MAARYVRAQGPLKAKCRWCLVKYIYNKRTSLISAAILTRLTASHPNSEVKLVRAGVVLRWGTTREGPVLRFCFFSSTRVIAQFAPHGSAGVRVCGCAHFCCIFLVSWKEIEAMFACTVFGCSRGSVLSSALRNVSVRAPCARQC